MKNIIAVLGLFIVFLSCVDSNKKEKNLQSEKNQSKSIIELNLTEIELGQYYDGKTTISASVSDVNGVIVILLLSDNRAYKMKFISNEKISKGDMSVFRANLERNFNINLDTNKTKKSHYYKYRNNLYYTYIEDSIAQDHYSILFSITDRELQKLNTLIVNDD